jgi:outer membrane immunogenic protein
MKIVALAVLASTVTGSAFAADMALKAPVAPAAAATWTGLYGGINAGAAWWSSSMAEQTINVGAPVGPIAYPSTTATQAAGGFQAGYNWQFSPQWVAGVEGDFSFASLNNSGPSTVIPGAGGNFVAMNESVQWLATARGRFGYVFGSTLWYATGGVAWERANYTGTTAFAAAPAIANTSFTRTNTGWVAGGGVEYMATQHVLMRVEYLYYGFRDQSAAAVCTIAGVVACGPPNLTSTYAWNNNNIQEIRAALSYKF